MATHKKKWIPGIQILIWRGSYFPKRTLTFLFKEPRSPVISLYQALTLVPLSTRIRNTENLPLLLVQLP